MSLAHILFSLFSLLFLLFLFYSLNDELVKMVDLIGAMIFVNRHLMISRIKTIACFFFAHTIFIITLSYYFDVDIPYWDSLILSFLMFVVVKIMRS